MWPLLHALFLLSALLWIEGQFHSFKFHSFKFHSFKFNNNDDNVLQSFKLCPVFTRLAATFRKHHWVVSKSEAVFKLVSKQPVGPSNSGPRVKYRQPSAAEETMLVDMSRASRSSTSDMGAGPRNFRLSSTFN